MSDKELLIQYLLTKRKLKQLSDYNEGCFLLVKQFLKDYLEIYKKEILVKKNNSPKLLKYATEILNSN